MRTESFISPSKLGFTVFFTGLSGSGKSTLANGLKAKLFEAGCLQVTMLDGDVVRTHLSSELGFSKEDRSINVRRVGYVAGEITRHGGIVICSLIAPYEADRLANREMISSLGGYVEVHVSTPLEVCEARDEKGLYAKARLGIINDFTGISDPYEAPSNPELVIDTSQAELSACVDVIVDKLKQLGYL